MKTIQNYTRIPRLPRIRTRPLHNSSSSLQLSPISPLSFFDSAPPPTSRPAISPSRLPVQLEGSPHNNGQPHNNTNPPFSLALTSPHSNSSSRTTQSSYQPTSFFPYFNPTSSTQPSGSMKRQKVRYQLDVGAYGIAKSCRRGVMVTPREGHAAALTNNRLISRSSEDLNLAVQVGEDAYFVRGNNAMGVADGVGGWSKVKNSGEQVCLHD
jgi:hypothetical protein